MLGMNEAKDVLRKCQGDFKLSMEESIEEFKREVVENKENFKARAPFATTKEFEEDNNKKAFDTIAHFQQECKMMREKEDEMQFGIEIFSIEISGYDELDLVEKQN